MRTNRAAVTDTISTLLWLAWAVTPVLVFYGWVTGNSLFDTGGSATASGRSTSQALYTAAWITGIAAPAAGLVLGLFQPPRRQTAGFAVALALSGAIAFLGWSAAHREDPAPAGPGGCSVHSSGGHATCGGG